MLFRGRVYEEAGELGNSGGLRTVKVADFGIARIYKKEKICDTRILGIAGYAASSKNASACRPETGAGWESWRKRWAGEKQGEGRGGNGF